MTNLSKFLITSVILIIIGIAGVLYFKRIPKDTVDSALYKVTTLDTAKRNQNYLDKYEVIASNLSIPWGLAFLPNGDLLVTERSGKLLRLGKENEKEIIQEIPGVAHIGEGGLMGLELHPKFSENKFLYLYLTTADNGGLVNRIDRYKFEDNKLSDKFTILANIPGANYHDGGRMEFGPDGKLYIGTGDAQDEMTAQDTNSLAGKVLRLNDDGTIPSDNPFGNAVYSYGHRNPQGLAWDNNGNLWLTEHGPSGTSTGNDELNLIVKGGNYGWPIIKGTQTKEGMLLAVLESGTKDTWAPAGTAYLNGSVFFSGLRGVALYEAVLSEDNKSVKELKKHFVNEFGRIRTVVVGPDGSLYITTSNRDGRGYEKDGDDKIIKIKL